MKPTRSWSAAISRGAPTIMRLRERHGIEERLPVAGDKLVCLRNNRRKGLFNGGLWKVKERSAPRGGILKLRLLPDADTFGAALGSRASRFRCGANASSAASRISTGRERKKYDEFDYGYVLTVHKAQGSQWDDVVLFDEMLRLPGQPRALALYRDHARGEEADGGGELAPLRSCRRSARCRVAARSASRGEL